MRLALFDLDHTLIPFDSGMAWVRFLVERGLLVPDVQERYLDRCREYVAGTQDIDVLHRMVVAPTSPQPYETVSRWLDEFETHIGRRLPCASKALVHRHRAGDDMCVLVTATTRLLAQRFAHLFDIPHVVATEPATAGGRFTGEIAGLPCHREQKLKRVIAWLAGQGLRLQHFERSWFYSDSAGDLPLLQAVTDPVAVRPDTRLREHAIQQGWQVIDELA